MRIRSTRSRWWGINTRQISAEISKPSVFPHPTTATQTYLQLYSTYLPYLYKLTNHMDSTASSVSATSPDPLTTRTHQRRYGTVIAAENPSVPVPADASIYPPAAPVQLPASTRALLPVYVSTGYTTTYSPTTPQQQCPNGTGSSAPGAADLMI